MGTKIFVGCALRPVQFVARVQCSGIRDVAAGEICADEKTFGHGKIPYGRAVTNAASLIPHKGSEFAE